MNQKKRGETSRFFFFFFFHFFFAVFFGRRLETRNLGTGSVRNAMLFRVAEAEKRTREEPPRWQNDIHRDPGALLQLLANGRHFVQGPR